MKTKTEKDKRLVKEIHSQDIAVSNQVQLPAALLILFELA